MPGKKTTKKTAKARPVPKRARTVATTAKKTLRSKSDADFAPVFSALRDLMAGHADELHVAHDEPKKYYLVTKSLSWRGGRMYFGAVIWGKAYVSYHLMPLYITPGLAKKISPNLKRRKQGKACFNFREVDKPLMSELNDLTKAGLEHYRTKNLL